jgi:hypothetical protein
VHNSRKDDLSNLEADYKGQKDSNNCKPTCSYEKVGVKKMVITILKKIIILLARIYIAICIIIFSVNLAFNLIHFYPMNFNVDFMEKRHCVEMGGAWCENKKVCLYKSQKEIRQ